MRIAVTGVRSVELNVASPTRAARFFIEPWGLEEVARDGDAVFLRGTAGFHHILALHPANGAGSLRRVVFEAPDCKTVDRLYERSRALTDEIEAPATLTLPGGGYGFGLRAPTGQALAVLAGAARHSDDALAADRPYKVAHVNFNEPERERLESFLVEALGFRVVDRAGRQSFLNADNPDHCSVVIAQSPLRTLNHIAFEMVDTEAVMRGGGRLQDHGYPIEWGPGRHGAANNSFCYFAGPEEIPLEYTADVLQISDDYEYHGPDYWQWAEGRLDQWGITKPHTRRWRRIQTLFECDNVAFQLHQLSHGQTITA